MSIYTGFHDMRTCSACSCATPDQSCSDGKATFSTTPDCNADGGVGTGVPLNCTGESIQGATQYYATLTAPPTPIVSLCAASGGSPSGSVMPMGPTTLCCM
jgi:hypothetical protein